MGNLEVLKFHNVNDVQDKTKRNKTKQKRKKKKQKQN